MRGDKEEGRPLGPGGRGNRSAGAWGGGKKEVPGPGIYYMKTGLGDIMEIEVDERRKFENTST